MAVALLWIYNITKRHYKYEALSFSRVVHFCKICICTFDYWIMEVDLAALDALDAELEEMLNCSICLEMFNDGARTPKFLVCHHSLCLMCLKVITWPWPPLTTLLWKVNEKFIFNYFFLSFDNSYRDSRLKPSTAQFVAAKPNSSQNNLLRTCSLTFTSFLLLKRGGLLRWSPINHSSSSSPTFGNLWLHKVLVFSFFL